MPPSSPDASDPADLSGHRALVTGAASGIGAAIAGRLALAGAVLIDHAATSLCMKGEEHKEQQDK